MIQFFLKNELPPHLRYACGGGLLSILAKVNDKTNFFSKLRNEIFALDCLYRQKQGAIIIAISCSLIQLCHETDY